MAKSNKKKVLFLEIALIVVVLITAVLIIYFVKYKRPVLPTNLPLNFPAGIITESDSKILTAGQEELNKEPYLNKSGTVYQSEHSLKSITENYEEYFEENGYKVLNKITRETFSSFSAYKQTQELLITIKDKDTYREVSITITNQ